MFGSIYRSHPEILIASLQNMSHAYRHAPVMMSSLKRVGVWIYISLLGIPEVGFQIRGMYFRKALKSLGKFAPRTMLDLGCGIGCYTLFLAKKYPQAHVEGWEIDKSKLKLAKEMKKQAELHTVEFTCGDITKASDAMGKYDFITTVDVLEHIREYKKALKNMYSLLKPNGHLYIHVPQVGQRRFFQKFRTWEHSDHVREGFEPEAIISELRNIGFGEITSANTFGYFGSLAWELNHMILEKSQALAGLFYPFLYGLAVIDILSTNKRGLGISILAKKI